MHFWQPKTFVVIYVRQVGASKVSILIELVFPSYIFPTILSQQDERPTASVADETEEASAGRGK